jgi:hypothetical protein
MLAGSLGSWGVLGTKWFDKPLAYVAALLEDELLDELELLDVEDTELLESAPLLESVVEAGAAGGVAGAGAS